MLSNEPLIVQTTLRINHSDSFPPKTNRNGSQSGHTYLFTHHVEGGGKKKIVSGRSLYLSADSTLEFTHYRWGELKSRVSYALADFFNSRESEVEGSYNMIVSISQAQMQRVAMHVEIHRTNLDDFSNTCLLRVTHVAKEQLETK